MIELLKIKPLAIPKCFRNGFEAYKLYSGVSAHIKGNFDGIKYRFKKPVAKKFTPESFPEKYLFDKFAKNVAISDWALYFGRNSIKSNWVRDFLGDDGENEFLAARGFVEAARQKFEGLFNSYLILLYNRKIKFSESLTGEAPLILVECSAGNLPPEFLILIDAVIPFLEKTDSFIYKELAHKLARYSNLFDINRPLLSDVIKSACS